MSTVVNDRLTANPKSAKAHRSADPSRMRALCDGLASEARPRPPAIVPTPDAANEMPSCNGVRCSTRVPITGKRSVDDGPRKRSAPYTASSQGRAASARMAASASRMARGVGVRACPLEPGDRIATRAAMTAR